MEFRLILFISILTACAHTPVEEIWDGKLISNHRVAPTVSFSGYNYYYSQPGPETKKLLGVQTTDAIEKRIRDYLEKADFKQVSSIRKSHLIVRSIADVVPDYKSSPGASNSSSPLRNRYAVAVFVTQYNERPKELVRVWSETQKAWADVSDELVEQIEWQFNQIPIGKSPKSNPAAGDPGCMPRFGFEAEPIMSDGKTVYRVWYVGAKSPAAKAGMKVGDTIISFNSLEYSTASVSEEIYKKNIPVPIELQRAETIIRATIKANLYCG